VILGVDMTKLEALAAAEQHVVLCDKSLANMKSMIAELERDGRDASAARQVLRECQQVRGLYAGDRDRLIGELVR
jgi:hypothetical protein